MGFLKAIQTIHVPCDEKLQMELKKLDEAHHVLLARTATMPRWALREEEKDEQGHYISGFPWYNDHGFLSEPFEKSYVLAYQSAKTMEWHGDSDYDESATIHGVAKLKDGTLYRIICTSEKMLNRFIQWTEEKNQPLQEDWGFVASIPELRKVKE